MTLLYAVDFSALANQTLTAGGAHSIDGYTWYAKGSLAPANLTFTRNLVNGSGLAITCVTNAGVTFGLGSNGDLTYPHWFFPLSQLAGYDALIPLLIRARFKYSALSASRHPVIGLCDTTSDGSNLLAAERAQDFFVGPAGSAGTTSFLSYKRGVANMTSSLVGRAGTIANTSCVVGVLTKTVGSYDIAGSEALVSGMPTTVHSAQLAGGSAVDPIMDPGARANEGIFFGVQDLSNASGVSVYLKQLRIDMLDGYDDPGPAPDTDPVVLNVISPPVGSEIGRHTPVVFDTTDAITDATRPLFVLVYAQYADGTTEVVWDSSDAEDVNINSGFKAAFRTNSTRATITDGFRFSVRRVGGWRSPPTFYVHAIDEDGNLDELAGDDGGPGP